MVSNFINRSISFFANKKKLLIISLSIIILFIVGFLYNTYATSTGVALGNEENTYDILLTDSTNTVEVPAKSSKTVYYQFSNTNKGTVKYHIGYTSNNVTAKVWWDTEDKISGTIEYGEYKFIKLKLINDTTEDDTITIKPVLGYLNGGDVIPDSNTTLITGTINKTNTMSIAPSTALNTLGIDKTTVEEISFVKDNIVPSDALGSTTVSSDNSVMLWYTASDTENMYKVYIGSDNGITSFPSDSSSMFKDFTKMTLINLNNIDTSNITNAGTIGNNGMFYNCSSLMQLDLSNFNTPNLKSTTSMFSNCSKLTSINISNFNTSNVTNMSYMFDGCSSLTDIDLSRLDTSNVTNMSYMFRGTKLSQININTSSCKDMSRMFMNSSATSLNLSTFNTSIVTNMSNMFNGSRSTNLDLSNFDTKKVTSMERMFYNTSLRRLDISNFTFSTTSIGDLFRTSQRLEYIDMRNADFANTSNNTMIFELVPTSVNVYLKDTQGNRDFMNNNYSSYTNVQYIPSE